MKQYVVGVSMPKEILNLKEYTNELNYEKTTAYIQASADKHKNILITTNDTHAIFMFEMFMDAYAFYQDMLKITKEIDIKKYLIERADAEA